MTLQNRGPRGSVSQMWMDPGNGWTGLLMMLLQSKTLTHPHQLLNSLGLCSVNGMLLLFIRCVFPFGIILGGSLQVSKLFKASFLYRSCHQFWSVKSLAQSLFPCHCSCRFWQHGKPDDWYSHGLGAGEDWAQLKNSNGWNDDHCSRIFSYIREKKIP